MRSKKYLRFVLLGTLLFHTMFPQDEIQIESTETYELSNVILALTPYGQEDEYEVQKGTGYYKEVMEYFKPYMNHPLLSKVNYSRQKWEDYLSFRTDAYAFGFDAKGKIKRRFSFFANKGHQPFDDNLKLVQDFCDKSNFRAFYKNHAAYFEGILKKYKSYYMTDKMRAFLIEEFGVQKRNTKNIIVVSPLVNRMNCRRNINKTTGADFATLGLHLINDSNEPVNEYQQIEDMHTLFTEMDHGYVNPVTTQYQKEVKENFNYTYWDRKSGYTDEDCFNEYMTWSVYDVFTTKYFPRYALQANRTWHLQNSTRGFIASGMFGEKLLALYHRGGKKIKDLYPELLKWTNEVQTKITVPQLDKDTLYMSAKQMNDTLRIEFTEALREVYQLDCPLFKVENGERTRLKMLSLTKGKDVFFRGKQIVIVISDIPKTQGLYGMTFNIWGQYSEVTNILGVALPCPTRVYIRVGE